MKLLAYIMNYADKFGNPAYDIPCWFNDSLYNNIIWKAHKMGLVFRSSVTQVHWTDKGIELYKKYIN